MNPKTHPKWMVASICFFLALACFRWQFMTDERLTWADAWSHHLWLGLIYDVAMACFPAGLGLLFSGLLKLPLGLGWNCVAFIMWIGHFANALYLRFFSVRMDAWVLKVHTQDVLEIDTAILSLAWTWPILTSFFFLCLGSVWMIRARAQNSGENPTPWRVIAHSLLLLCFALGLRQFPRWFYPWEPFHSALTQGNPLTDSILKIWWDQLLSGEASLKQSLLEDFHHFKEQQLNPQFFLASLRDGTYPGSSAPSRPPDMRILDPQWPLHVHFSPQARDTRTLRKRLGLPETGKVNVLILFLESVRAFEFDHPQVGPHLFPHLKEILSKHAWYFKQAYSSSGGAGQTARGQFSSLCSLYPNFGAPATYRAFSHIELTCLPEFFRRQNYQTVFATGHDVRFHGTHDFESRHGTQLFFGETEFKQRGATQHNAGMGLADKPTLETLVGILEELHRGGPFFATFFTLSTHYPYTAFPEGALPSEVIQAVGDSDKDYVGYLSTLRYLDVALGNFFEKFFATEMAKNTVILLQADHSIHLPPTLPLEGLSTYEYGYRIPMALITQTMPQPKIIPHPVHQADIAPMLGRIAGVSGNVSWIGRGLLEPSGLPWVFRDEGGLAYRTQDRACYPKSKEKLQCWDISGNRDPLWETQTFSPLPENPAQSEFFNYVVKSMRLLITTNTLMPKKSAWFHYAPNLATIMNL